MLPEFFATLVIDEDKVGTDSDVDRRVVRFNGPEDSVLLERPAGWFLNDNLVGYISWIHDFRGGVLLNFLWQLSNYVQRGYC